MQLDQHPHHIVALIRRWIPAKAPGRSADEGKHSNRVTRADTPQNLAVGGGHWRHNEVEAERSGRLECRLETLERTVSGLTKPRLLTEVIRGYESLLSIRIGDGPVITSATLRDVIDLGSVESPAFSNRTDNVAIQQLLRA